MAYDEKFRRKAVEYKDKGHTFKQLKDIFGISSSTYYKWRRNKEKSGFYVLPKTGKAVRKGKIDPEQLKAFIDKNPDMFYYEIAEKFDCSAPAIFKRCKQLKITHKKRHSPTQKNPMRKGQNI